MSDKYALTEDRKNDIVQRVVDIMLDGARDGVTADEQRLVDLHLHMQTVENRVGNMSAMVQRTIGTTIDVGAALTEYVRLSETSAERASVTVAWVIKLLSRFADPTGEVVSVASLLESMVGSMRIDAEEFGFEPDAWEDPTA